MLKYPWAKFWIPASCRANAAALWLTSEFSGEATDFSSGINTIAVHLSYIPDIITAFVIMKLGVKTDKQTAFLWRTQWESCLITPHTSDKDNAAAARKLNLFYWRKSRSCPKPNMVINSSPYSSVIMLTATVLFIPSTYWAVEITNTFFG